jgi:phage shock protein E
MFFFKKEFEDITARAYNSDFVKGKQPHALIDVRTPGEYAQGHVPGAVNIPLNELDRRISEVPSDKPVIVICASGNRSQAGATKIKKSGIEKVYNVQGGTLGWMREGLKTVK